MGVYWECGGILEVMGRFEVRFGVLGVLGGIGGI